MTWKSDHKGVMQQYYGGYCNLCKLLQISPVPYHSFTLEIHQETKLKFKELKKTK